MPVRQWVHEEPSRQENEQFCMSRGPLGWLCCLLDGHEGNHIGLLVGYKTLSQWEADDDH